MGWIPIRIYVPIPVATLPSFFGGGGGGEVYLIYLTYVLVNTFLTFFYDAALNFFLSKVIESDSGSESVRDVTEFDSLN